MRLRSKLTGVWASVVQRVRAARHVFTRPVRGSPPNGTPAATGGGLVALAFAAWYKVRLFQKVSKSEGYAMSRVCQVTGKGPKTGNTVSHANNRTRRRFLPNLHSHRFWLETEKRYVSLRVTTRGLRTIEKRGVDAVVADLRAQGVKI